LNPSTVARGSTPWPGFARRNSLKIHFPDACSCFAAAMVCRGLLLALDRAGQNVGFVSLTGALDLATPAGRAMAGLLAIFAEFEREILRDRTRAGLAHARQNGKRLGRPITAATKASEVRVLHRAGISKAEIARRLQIGRTSVRRILAPGKAR